MTCVKLDSFIIDTRRRGRPKLTPTTIDTYHYAHVRGPQGASFQRTRRRVASLESNPTAIHPVTKLVQSTSQNMIMWSSASSSYALSWWCLWTGCSTVAGRPGLEQGFLHNIRGTSTSRWFARWGSGSEAGRATIPENDCVALAVAAATTALVVLLIAVTCSRGLNSIICPAMYST